MLLVIIVKTDSNSALSSNYLVLDIQKYLKQLL